VGVRPLKVWEAAVREIEQKGRPTVFRGHRKEQSNRAEKKDRGKKKRGKKKEGALGDGLRPGEMYRTSKKKKGF